MDNRTALYIRVSSENQHLDNQRAELVQVARTRGLEIVAVYEEKASAGGSRPEFDRLMLAAHRGEFSQLLVWSLDRLGRSMVGNVQTVMKLDSIRVQVISVREPWLDTSGPVRSLLIGIFGWIAEQERAQVRARTVAGLDRARRQGVRIGRPPARVDLARAAELRAQGLSYAQIARELRVGASTLHRLLRADEQLRAAARHGVPKPTAPALSEPSFQNTDDTAAA